MYAVIATGGKQYKVTKGETLRVEKLDGDEGSTVKLDKVVSRSAFASFGGSPSQIAINADPKSAPSMVPFSFPFTKTPVPLLGP